MACVAAPAAAAHGPFEGQTGYISTVAGLEPHILGVTVTVLGGDKQLQLTNYSGKTIEVLGSADEPFLRFTKNGIYKNLRSPEPGAPTWSRVSVGSSFAWHERRIHWHGALAPAVVRNAPDVEHRIFAWHVPARADGKPFTIDGFLGYRPAAHAAGHSHTTRWIVAAAAVALLALAVAAGARRRMTQRRAP